MSLKQNLYFLHVEMVFVGTEYIQLCMCVYVLHIQTQIAIFSQAHISL